MMRLSLLIKLAREIFAITLGIIEKLRMNRTRQREDYAKEENWGHHVLPVTVSNSASDASNHHCLIPPAADGKPGEVLFDRLV